MAKNLDTETISTVSTQQVKVALMENAKQSVVFCEELEVKSYKMDPTLEHLTNSYRVFKLNLHQKKCLLSHQKCTFNS